MGTEWLEQAYLPLFEALSLADRLRTHIEVLKTLCIKHFEALGLQKVYLTGGGAHNQFLIETIQNAFVGKLIVPEPELIDFKEAIIFAFLGARHLRNETAQVSCTTTKAYSAKKLSPNRAKMVFLQR